MSRFHLLDDSEPPKVVQYATNWNATIDQLVTFLSKAFEWQQCVFEQYLLGFSSEHYDCEVLWVKDNLGVEHRTLSPIEPKIALIVCMTAYGNTNRGFIPETLSWTNEDGTHAVEHRGRITEYSIRPWVEPLEFGRLLNACGLKPEDASSYELSRQQLKQEVRERTLSFNPEVRLTHPP